MGLFEDLKKGEKVKELTKKHGFRFYKGYDSEGVQKVSTMCGVVVNATSATPDLNKVTCKKCKKKFQTKKTYKK